MPHLNEWKLYIQKQQPNSDQETCSVIDVTYEDGFAYLANFVAEHFVGEKLKKEHLITRTPERGPAIDYHLIPSDEGAFDPPRWKTSDIVEITLARVRASEKSTSQCA